MLAFALFSRWARRPLAWSVPLLRFLRVERPIRALYEGIHAYRDHAGLLVAVFALTFALQAVRVLAIWLAAKSAGVDLSPRIFYVMGPLLFLVILVPFTINGLAVREAFFVSFLGQVGVSADARVRHRLPLLPRDDRDLDPGGADPRLGGRARPGPRGPCLTSRRSSSPTTRRPTSSGRSSRCAASRRSSSTTARATARLALVRERFPEARVVEQENVGPRRRLERGHAGRLRTRATTSSSTRTPGSPPGALDRLVAFADAHPRAAVVGPRLRYPDGRLQRSVRGFPTLWRLATEYLFLRKLAPRSRLLNAYYGGGFGHDEVAEVEWLMGAVLLVRREAVEEVGPADDAFFLFAEETDWCKRFRDAGWSVVFVPDAEASHVLGATHGGRLLRENVRGHLRWLAKHRGPAYAERARRLLAWALALRGALFRGERGRSYADTARWLRSGSVPALLER